jgi:hypothetical protein
MTTEEKRLISDYMGLNFNPARVSLYEHENGREFHFDLNDAGLCVKKMQRQEDWDDFITYVEADDTECHTWSQFFAWLYNADYFFESMAKWLKEEENEKL